jgi:hypothetical protein
MNEGLFISSRAWIEAARVFMNGDGRIPCSWNPPLLSQNPADCESKQKVTNHKRQI